MKKDKNNKKKKNEWIVPFVICSVFIFTGIAIFLQFTTSTELSSTLITCFYAFCTGELWVLSSIEKAKIYTDIDNDGIPDEEDTYIDPSYIQEAEEAIERLKKKMNGEE